MLHSPERPRTSGLRLAPALKRLVPQNVTGWMCGADAAARHEQGPRCPARRQVQALRAGGLGFGSLMGRFSGPGDFSVYERIADLGEEADDVLEDEPSPTRSGLSVKQRRDSA